MFIINNKNADDCKERKDVALSAISPKDRPWDRNRALAQDVQNIYQNIQEFEKLGKRISECSGILRFGQTISEDGEILLKLREVQFCRVRHCPVCQWRRSLMWQARFYQGLPNIEAEFPKARWVFLTLTVRNCEVTDLKQTLQEMGKSWQRLIKRKEFSAVQGWIRSTEVTKAEDALAHPHFHIMLMVPPSWFTGKYYVKQARWTEIWQECLRVNYTPVVNVKAVKPKKDLLDNEGNKLRGAIAETLKYSVKPSEMTEDPEWFLELTRQVHKMRFIASGGALKNILKVEQETDAELALNTDSGNGDDGSRIGFNFRAIERRYRRYQKADRPADK